MKKTIKTQFSKALIVATVMFILGCKKFVLVDPPNTSLMSTSVFMNEATATAALLNVYYDMSASDEKPFQGERSLSWVSSLMSDEFTSYFNDNRAEFAEHVINPENTIVQLNWSALYRAIYSSNIIIEQMNNSNNFSRSFKESLEAEARFVRALMYFYLVNFWEQVPLVLTTDYNQNRILPKSNKEAIYAQIIQDLKTAQQMLGEQYNGGGRVRPNRFTATALLAKVYLHTQQWERAIEESSAVIESGLYYLENDLNQVFLTTSKEVIWHLEAVSPSVYTWDGFRFILMSAPTRVMISDSLRGAFDKEDKRLSDWIGRFSTNGKDYYFPYKYKVIQISDQSGASPEFLVMFRLAEQYLIRAECRTMMGDIEGAIDDLSNVRNRAGLESFDKRDQNTILDAIFNERRLELFTEGCNRWFDLKRRNMIKTNLLPIPQNEIMLNPNLIQNSGY